MLPGRLVLSGDLGWVLGASGVSAGDGGELKGSESCAGHSFAAVAVLQRRGLSPPWGCWGLCSPKQGRRLPWGAVTGAPNPSSLVHRVPQDAGQRPGAKAIIKPLLER